MWLAYIEANWLTGHHASTISWPQHDGNKIRLHVAGIPVSDTCLKLSHETVVPHKFTLHIERPQTWDWYFELNWRQCVVVIDWYCEWRVESFWLARALSTSKDLQSHWLLMHAPVSRGCLALTLIQAIAMSTFSTRQSNNDCNYARGSSNYAKHKYTLHCSVLDYQSDHRDTVVKFCLHFCS